ncbi:hypothetical protein SGFS_006490 [Streptomyces graminofaciens]|uniref:Uncharacterized protein n=1 Tax=Streptomyces graminofaciens TaxID=68212 RepID=A0ABM7F0V8_9ACTN|nr:hypothetical protein SGFS_006490 [Streptomyces graminofaciens]
MIVGRDDDPAGEATRVTNLLHGPLTHIHPSPERVLRGTPGGPPSFQSPDVHAGNRRQDRSTDPHRGRRRHHLPHHPPPRRPHRPHPRDPQFRLVDPRRTAIQARKQAAQERFRPSAFTALSDPASRAQYDKKITQGKHHTQALLCPARRRADVLFAMPHDGIFHEPQAPGAG